MNVKRTTIPIKNLDIGHIIKNPAGEYSIILTLSRKHVEPNSTEIVFTQTNPIKPFNNTSKFSLSYPNYKENQPFEVFENTQKVAFELID